MEIERKYLIKKAPDNYQSYPYHDIEQAYLNIAPVVRIRKEDNLYYMTYKSKGLLAREEYNLPLTQEAYYHLLKKADGIILTKRRYLIPLESSSLTIELDIFSGHYAGLMLAEVEFPDIDSANSFTAPSWFYKDVTFSGEYQNSKLSISEI